jgi:Calcineurin-like phosphoesterase
MVRFVHSVRGDSRLTDSFAGQFYDLLHLLTLTGEPSLEHILLMNGDLVDRGSWSVEVILVAFAFKCQEPFVFTGPISP